MRRRGGDISLVSRMGIIGPRMPSRALAIGICVALASTAQAATLRAWAEAPFSAERLGDALRSYLAGAKVTVSPPAASPVASDAAPDPGLVYVTLRRFSGAPEDAELVLVDGEETILVRLPGTMRAEDLYRAVALKVQAVVQRKASGAVPGQVVEAADARAQVPSPPRDCLSLDAGIALLVPSDGLARAGFRLGVDTRFARRGRLGLGAYFEQPRSSNVQGIEVSTWEIPLWLSVGVVWHQGSWLGWMDGTGQAAIRRISAESPGIVSNSDTALSPRAGGTLGLGLPVGQAVWAEVRASLLAVLADARYRVEGQVISPSARLLMLIELGLVYGLR